MLSRRTILPFTNTFCGFLPVLSVCLITLGASRGYRDGYGRYATLGEEKGRQRPRLTERRGKATEFEREWRVGELRGKRALLRQTRPLDFRSGTDSEEHSSGAVSRRPPTQKVRINATRLFVNYHVTDAKGPENASRA